jgi:adenylate cyclase
LADAKHLLDHLCLKPLIEKTRFTLHHGGSKWEIDEFDGENRGLIVAEIELSDERQQFDKPDWVGQEVTADVRYYNSHLVRHPYSAWASPSE